ncbi:protein cordon-bleu-like isoform X1 [Centruroides vittatus]|uniref:protein cordon-bleu-like isoform X1 n=1 Tax=Centruroides vittatus TaxID=120091 RepID=UPI00350FD480
MGLEDKENENQEKTSNQNTMQNTARRRPKMKKAPPPPCVAGEKTNGTISNLSTHEVMAHHLSEDCAINELLEGNMDLEVVLPDSKIVRMTVERRIPMMDLLVQVTKANKISPGGHFISLSPNNKDNLHYKPNTPIGSLDTNTIYIMSKSAMNDQPAAKMLRSQSQQPFEKTFRLQVNLPKKQLMVVRVSPKTTLAEIKRMICTEKKLEYSQYYLVHPSQPSYLIDLNYSLSEYGCTEVSLVNKSTMNSTISNSTSDLIGYPISMTEDEKKKKKLLNIFKRKSKSVNNMVLAGEAFKDTASSRGVSPARSDICDTHSLRTKRQSTKKRAPPPPPLPPPPPPVQPQPEVTAEAEISTKTNSSSEPVSTTVGSTTIITTMVSHSRQSSDSSGYHEASVLSDSPDNLSPETSSGSGSSGIHSTDNTEQENQKVAVSKSNSRLKTREKPNFSSVAHSMLILNTNKKRKAPPPPPQPNVNKETMKPNTEINAISSEKDITPVSNDENDLPSKTVTEVKPVTIEIVNDSSNKDATSPVQKSADPDSCKSPIKNGVDSIPSEQGDASPLSSPTNSSPSHNDSLTEPETPDSNTKNHRHTEEETGEVIHFLEKGEISSKSSIIQELISDFIPPPLEFSTPSTPTENVNTNEKKPEPIPRTNVNRDDSFKTKTFPTPHPRLTLQNSSIEPNKSCRRSLNFSDQPSDQKTIEKDKTAIHLHDTHTVEDKVSNEDTKTTVNCSDEMSINPIRKDEDDVDKELIPNSLEETNEEAVEISDPEWDFSIPEPPSPFRNNRDNSISLESELFKNEVHLFPENNDSIENIVDYSALKEITETPRAENSDCLQDKADDDLIDNYPPSLPETMPPRDKCFRVGSMSSDIPPPLPISDPPESAREKSYSLCSTSSEVSFPEFDPTQRENDTNSAYKEFKTVSKNETDIKKVDDDKFVGISRIDITNKESISTQTYIVVPQPKRRPHLENFTIGSYKNEKTNSDVTDSPSFSASLTDTDKSSNLIQTNSFPKDDDKESNKVNKPTYNFTIMPFKSRNSYNENKVDQNKGSDELLQEETVKVEEVRNKNQMSFKSTGREEDTKIEQRQLEEEYQKLQNQLLVWQQQLVKNQTLLQEKRIVPEMSVPDLSPLCSQPKVEEKSSVAQRSRTLPRPKPNVNKELVEQTHSSTVEYYSQPKSQILKNVTIGSWERKPEITVGTVAEVKPKFQNANKSQVNNSVVDKCKKSSVLLEDNEKNKISQISAKFDIKSSNNKTAVANNMPENLEDAPPAVILAQIRKEMKANAKYPAGTVINSESKKGTSVSKTYIRPKSQIIYSHYNSASDDRISDLTKSSSQDPIKVNGNINRPVVVATIKSKPALNKDVVNGDKNTVSLPVSSSVSIPPPPLPPVVPINKNSSKFQSTSHLLKVSKTEPLSDPREELMIEIRNFGGRKALRKVS